MSNNSSQTSNKLPFTGERYVPGQTGAQISYEHLHRYFFARQFCKDKRVLDLGSGAGYGTEILAKTASSVVGIELDQQALEHAKVNCRGDNISFIQGSATKPPAHNDVFDVAVCFEVLEHVKEQDALLAHAQNALTQQGLLIISTPNRVVYTDQQGNKNPFHVSELYRDEFESLLSKYFANLKLFGQRVGYQSDIWDESKQGHHTDLAVSQANETFTEANKTLDRAVYYVALASQGPIDPACSSTLTDLDDSLESETSERIRALAGEREQCKHTAEQLLHEHRKLSAILSKREKEHAETIAALQKKILLSSKD